MAGFFYELFYKLGARLYRLGARLVEAVRYTWLNIYALVALAVGVVFAAWVPQTREIFSNLVAGSAFLSGGAGGNDGGEGLGRRRLCTGGGAYPLLRPLLLG